MSQKVFVAATFLQGVTLVSLHSVTRKQFRISCTQFTYFTNLKKLHSKQNHVICIVHNRDEFGQTCKTPL